MKNVVVVGSQWGDEGKGKIVDWLSSEADILVKPNVAGIHWSDFENFNKLLYSGKSAMEKILNRLKNSDDNSIYKKLIGISN